MKPFKLVHDRPNCIGCGACAAIAPEFWEMTEPDGKSDIIGSEKIMENDEIKEETRDIEQKDYDNNFEAAECCPVNVIHIVDKEKDKKII